MVSQPYLLHDIVDLEIKLQEILFTPFKFKFVNTLRSDQNDHQFANDVFK